MDERDFTIFQYKARVGRIVRIIVAPWLFSSVAPVVDVTACRVCVSAKAEWYVIRSDRYKRLPDTLPREISANWESFVTLTLWYYRKLYDQLDVFLRVFLRKFSCRVDTEAYSVF